MITKDSNRTVSDCTISIHTNETVCENGLKSKSKKTTVSFKRFQKLKAVKAFKSFFSTPEDGISNTPSSNNTSKRNLSLSFIKKNKEENRKEKNLKLIGDLGEFHPKQVALQLSVLLFETDDNNDDNNDDMDANDNSYSSNNGDNEINSVELDTHTLDWKHTIDLHARWCITFTLLGDEKAAGGLPNVETGVARILFLIKIALECRKLGNIMASRGITKGLCHSHLVWLWDFVPQKHVKKINDLRKLSKTDIEITNTVSLQKLNITNLSQKIKGLQSQNGSIATFSRDILSKSNDQYEHENSQGATQIELDLKRKLSRAASEPESTSDDISECEVPQLESGSESGTVLLRASKSEPLGTTESKALASLVKMCVDRTVEIKDILRLQIARARTSSELKTLSLAIKNKLSWQMARVLKDSGLM